MMSLAAADCWKHGANANQDIGKSSVRDISAIFQGHFVDNQMRYACYSDYPSGNSYIYSIRRLRGYGGATLDIVKINDWLWREASACRYGGKSIYEHGWEVK
jgi:hypothetical protein